MSSSEIPEHVSAVRLMMAQAIGVEYHSAATLTDARALTEYTLVLEGDYGGQIYAVCPINFVKCDEACLRQLLADLDGIQWSIPEGCELFFEYAPVGSRIGGGMGGGEVVGGVWCHEEIHAINMASAVADVIEGRASRLAIPSLEKLEELARAGNVNAQYFLAKRLRKSSPPEAIKWFRAAGEQEHLGAMTTLSIMRKVDIEERVRWMKALAKRNDQDSRVDSARFRLADALDKGEGVERDLAAAADLYILLCEKRYSARGALRLAEKYLYGQGVEKNQQLSAMWLMLGSVPHCNLPPHWGRIATRSEQEQAKELLARVINEMTPEDVVETEGMAQRYCADDRQR